MRGGLRFERTLKVAIFSALSILLINISPLQSTRADSTVPQSGSVGLQGTIPSAPPSKSASIALPANGATFTSIPITMSGLCPDGLLIKIFDNGIFVGSTVCVRGSYTLQVNLFNGQNQLIARDYDSLDQEGPDSTTVTVTYNGAQFLQFGTPLTLSSTYAENGAPPGTEINWPIQINGGTGPFAVSVDWGDNSPQELVSASEDGTISLKHTYQTAGIYTVVVKAVDKNNETAFLQLVGQATGAIQSNAKTTGSNSSTTPGKSTILLWPTFAMIPLIFVAFWLGRKHEEEVIRKRYLGPDE